MKYYCTACPWSGQVPESFTVIKEVDGMKVRTMFDICPVCGNDVTCKDK